MANTVSVFQKKFWAKPQSQRMSPPRTHSPLGKLLAEERLRGRDVLGISDLDAGELQLVLNVAALLKANKFDDTQTLFAKGQTLAMLFEKPSLRTRVTFEAGIVQLGGNAIYLEGPLGERESVSDIAKNLDRWLDCIMARVFKHETLVELAANASIPVISGLCDLEHPCQAFADFLTLEEHKGKIGGLKLAFIGDGNNVAHSLMLFSAKMGVDFTIACPPGYEPDKNIVQSAQTAAEFTGATIVVTQNPYEAVSGADAVYTDTWISMGQEDEKDQREKDFMAYQVDSCLIGKAKSDAIVMHCLPAHRGSEITADVIDGPQSVVFDQAENRLHVQKALMTLIM